MRTNNYVWEKDLSLNDLVLNQKEEIDKLVDNMEDLDREFSRYKYESKKEIERLNNIINELEKWLEEQHQFIIEIPAYTKEISIEHKTMEICYGNVLDKLQELKGEDKEC